MIGTIRTTSTLQGLMTDRRQAADLSQKLSQAGQEAATGLKSDVYRSLGLRSGETLALRARMDRTDAFLVSNEQLGDKLALTAKVMGNLRDVAQGFLDNAITSRDQSNLSTSVLQANAKAALDQITAQINTSFGGAPLFSGTISSPAALQPFDKVNPRSGLSPRDVLGQVVGAGLTDAADANGKLDQLAAIFASDATAPAAQRFESTFYNGTPRLAADGSAAARVSARIDENLTLDHGVQANDPAFSEMIRGLTMMASLDASKIADPDAYKAWVGSALDGIGKGIGSMLEAEARIGGQQQQVEQTLGSQRARSDLFRNQVLALEGVDAYEAATRVTQLQTQLEATYAVTSRLSKLSFLNFM